MKLPYDVSLIMRSGSAPVKARQWIWYKEASMKGLSCSASFVPMQLIVHYPFVRTAILEEVGRME